MVSFTSLEPVSWCVLDLDHKILSSSQLDLELSIIHHLFHFMNWSRNANFLMAGHFHDSFHCTWTIKLTLKGLVVLCLVLLPRLVARRSPIQTLQHTMGQDSVVVAFTFGLWPHYLGTSQAPSRLMCTTSYERAYSMSLNGKTWLPWVVSLMRCLSRQAPTV